MPAQIDRSSKLEGVVLVSFAKFADPRGHFFETYRRTWLPEAREMIQGNCSVSKAGVLRGLHYHMKQADFWFVPMGRVRAVLVDVREGSPTKGAVEVRELSSDEPAGLYIPRGIAHGFLALEDTMMSYLVDEYYDNTDELGVLWNDPALGVNWGAVDPIVSARDASNPLLADIPASKRPRFTP